jgi:hypothetical protein
MVLDGIFFIDKQPEMAYYSRKSLSGRLQACKRTG